MQLLFLTYQGGIAGSTNSISYLVKGLAGLGHDVYVGCPENSYLYQCLENTSVHRIPMTFPSKTELSSMRRIRDIVRECNIQIICTQASKDRYLAMLAKLLFQLPAEIIHTRRQMCKSVGGPMAFLTAMTSKGIVAVSKEVKRSLVQRGFSRKLIRVIPNGTPVDKFQHIDNHFVNTLKLKYKIKDSDIVIGVVSRMKDQHQLVKALPYLPFRTKVIFVGITEEDLGTIRDEDRQDHELFFTGKIDPSEALAHYKLFTVKVLPSRMEGLSQSLLEAMYLRVPVVVTADGGNLSLIRHEVNGLFFHHNHPLELASQIERIIRMDKLREQIVQHAAEQVRNHYSVQQTVLAYEEYFDGILTANVPKRVPLSYPV